MLKAGYTKAEIDKICDGSGSSQEKTSPQEERMSPQDQQTGMWCCDTFGNRRCGGNISLPLGSSCFCPGQGFGIVCE